MNSYFYRSLSDKILGILLTLVFLSPIGGNVVRVLAHTALFLIWIFCYSKFKIKCVKSIYLKWGVVFLFYCICSIGWAFDKKLAVSVCIFLFANFVMAYIIINYVKGKRQLFVVIDSILYAEVIIFVWCVITSSISDWGTAYFTSGVNLHRNEVAMSAALISCFAMYAGYITGHKKYKILWLINFVLAIVPASRKAMLVAVGVVAVFVLLTSKNVKVLLQRVLIVICAIVILVLILYNVPFLRENYWDRLLALISFFDESKELISDNSVYKRKYFIEQAMEAFKSHPIFGCGVNNFQAYLGIIGYNRPTYAHNDYAELLADVGIVGLIICYWKMIKVFMFELYLLFVKKKVEIVSFIFLIMFFVAGVGTVTYYQSFYSAALAITFAIYERSRDFNSDISEISIKF